MISVIMGKNYAKHFLFSITKHKKEIKEFLRQLLKLVDDPIYI